jgi:hypothetical protein
VNVESLRWLSVEQAAEYTQTDPDWIMLHIKTGALPAVQTAIRKRADGPGRRRYRVDRRKLDALMEQLEVAGRRSPDAERKSPPPRMRSSGAEKTLDELLKENGLL